MTMIPTGQPSRSRSLMTTADLALIGMCAALIAVCAWITIPTIVPFTLQTFAIFFTAALLGDKKGTITVSVYILLGVVGLPVFSGFRGGAGVLLGPTGGYIVGFLCATLIMWLMEKGRTLCRSKLQSRVLLVSSMLAGMISYYFFGTVWFMIAYAQSSGAIGLGSVLSICVIPFVIPDLIKIAVAATLATRLRPFIRRVD